MVRTRAEWEAWFHGLFERLDAMSAATDSPATRCSPAPTSATASSSSPSS
jgi:hypothetical protein